MRRSGSSVVHGVNPNLKKKQENVIFLNTIFFDILWLCSGKHFFSQGSCFYMFEEVIAGKSNTKVFKFS